MKRDHRPNVPLPTGRAPIPSSSKTPGQVAVKIENISLTLAVFWIVALIGLFLPSINLSIESGLSESFSLWGLCSLNIPEIWPLRLVFFLAAGIFALCAFWSFLSWKNLTFSSLYAQSMLSLIISALLIICLCIFMGSVSTQTFAGAILSGALEKRAVVLSSGSVSLSLNLTGWILAAIQGMIWIGSMVLIQQLNYFRSHF